MKCQGCQSEHCGYGGQCGSRNLHERVYTHQAQEIKMNGRRFGKTTERIAHLTQLINEKDSRIQELEAHKLRLETKFKECARSELKHDIRADELQIRVDELTNALKDASEALEFYSGEARDTEWEGCKFLAFDKFGALCAELTGPYIAQQALEVVRKVLKDKK